MPNRSMATTARQPAAALLSADKALTALDAARRQTLALVAPLSDADLVRVHSPIMSPLVWDLGHIAAFEDLWLVHRFGGRPLLHPELTAAYDAFETPRALRGELELLGPADARAYLDQVRARTREALERRDIGDGLLHALVIAHERQHVETMLQTLALAHLSGYVPPGRRQAPAAPGGHTGLETVEVPAGAFELGAPSGRFGYDNEHPRHQVELPAFRIGRTPVTNASWLSFTEGGGYERREWWSEEGWAWKQEYDVERPGGWVADPGQRPREWRLGGLELLHPHTPVVGVSWFEADAFARAHGVRLPTEAEWEKAATWDESTGETLPWPWGEQPPEGSHARANVIETGLFGTAPVGAYPDGVSPCGAIGMLGDVWEWTESHFGGYPGFVAHPYREYSEVFFGDSYRVLRGGSWATSISLATPTFRNWDLPQRRQIFAGVRICEDA
jgi:iron(II)-dependent oxidoreductase